MSLRSSPKPRPRRMLTPNRAIAANFVEKMADIVTTGPVEAEIMSWLDDLEDALDRAWELGHEAGRGERR